MSKFGTFARGELVDVSPSRDGRYTEFLVSTDKRFAPVRFSAAVASPLDTQLESIQIGDVVEVTTSSPRLATSKAGKQYVSYFAIAISNVSSSDETTNSGE